MNILEKIVQHTKAQLVHRKAAVSVPELEQKPAFSTPTRPLASALRKDHIKIIAELKKASPSKGLIRSDFNPTALAQSYEQHGAAAISVLTEPDYFQGALENLSVVRQVVDVPLLRKDFIVDAYQLIEARAYGADAVLLIAAVLDAKALFDLHQTANALGLDCLVELYNIEELDKLDLDQVNIVGVNNRDLRTFEVDVDNSLRVFDQVPDSVVRVSESGLKTASDLVYVRQAGIDAVLIGETFMRAPDPGATLRTLIDETEHLLRSEQPLRGVI